MPTFDLFAFYVVCLEEDWNSSNDHS